MRLGLSSLAVLLAAFAVRAEPPAKKVDAKAVRAKLAGDWREFDVRIPREKQLRELFGIEWGFFKPLGKDDPPNRAFLTDHDNESQQVVGEVVLNADADPMWLDFEFTDAGKEYVWVGIARFEGDDLRWVRGPGWVSGRAWAEAKGKVAARPSAFEDARKQPLDFRLEPLRPMKK